MSPARRLGFGIVGCGGAAVDVAAAIARSGTCRVTAAHDLRTELASDLAAPSGATVHLALETLLADPAVEAVYVAIPHDRLSAVAGRALAAGRPVLVEKPMATDLASIDRLAAAARRRGLALGVMFELRYTGPALVAMGLVRGGAIGRVSAVRIRTLIDKPESYWRAGYTARVASEWRASLRRSGGGVVLMNAIHQIDLVHAITGLSVERVTGEIGTLMTNPTRVEVEDTAAATFRFSTGAIGSLVAGAHSPGARNDETIEIDGTGGSLRLPDLYGDGSVAVYLRQRQDDIPAGAWVSIASQPADPFRSAVEEFARATLEGRPAPVGAPEAAAALAVVLRLYGDQRHQPERGRTS